MIKSFAGPQYVSDGLVVLAVSRHSAGTYTCRARVPQTGELEERDLRLEVQEPPTWVVQPEDTRAVEGRRVEPRCLAQGSPPPEYEWL